MQWDSSGIASKEVVLGSPALTSWISWLWLTSAAKADSESEPFIAAVNRSHPITPKAGVLGTRRCATQNQGRHRLSCALGIPMHRSFASLRMTTWRGWIADARCSRHPTHRKERDEWGTRNFRATIFSCVNNFSSRRAVPACSARLGWARQNSSLVESLLPRSRMRNPQRRPPVGRFGLWRRIH